MKKFYVVVFSVAVLITSVVFVACGSSWEISGNNMTIIKVDNDTIAPAGSFIVLPDSAHSSK